MLPPPSALLFDLKAVCRGNSRLSGPSLVRRNLAPDYGQAEDYLL